MAWRLSLNSRTSCFPGAGSHLPYSSLLFFIFSVWLSCLCLFCLAIGHSSFVMNHWEESIFTPAEGLSHIYVSNMSNSWRFGQIYMVMDPVHLVNISQNVMMTCWIRVHVVHSWCFFRNKIVYPSPWFLVVSLECSTSITSVPTVAVFMTVTLNLWQLSHTILTTPESMIAFLVFSFQSLCSENTVHLKAAALCRSWPVVLCLSVLASLRMNT